jgi:hypothetical protein
VGNPVAAEWAAAPARTCSPPDSSVGVGARAGGNRLDFHRHGGRDEGNRGVVEAEKGERYLSPTELGRLDDALAEAADAQLETAPAIAAIRLLILAGSEGHTPCLTPIKPSSNINV